MPEEMRLPAIAAAILMWGLVCALRQTRARRSTGPRLIWRQAGPSGWSDWLALKDIPASADYSFVLGAVRARAAGDATAVQFASVAHPADAPDYTLRVLFMSNERPATPDRDVAPNH
jgi:hypothetical protein